MRLWDGINYPFRHFRTELQIQIAFQEIPGGRQLYALGPVLDGAARAVYLRYISGGGEVSLDGFLALARELFHSNEESLRLRMEISKLRVREPTGPAVIALNAIERPPKVVLSIQNGESDGEIRKLDSVDSPCDFVHPRTFRSS